MDYPGRITFDAQISSPQRFDGEGKPLLGDEPLGDFGLLAHSIKAIEVGVIRFTANGGLLAKRYLILINFSVVYECLWRTREFSRGCVVAKIAGTVVGIALIFTAGALEYLQTQ
jgi:hypothetical protein